MVALKRRGESGETDLIDELDSSPYPWLADEVWRLWNFDIPKGVLLDEGVSPISQPILTVVTSADKSRARKAVSVAHGLIPPAGSLDEHEALLDSTRGVGFIGSVRWPVCCHRLATLIMNCGGGIELGKLEAETGPLDDALLEAHVSDGRDPRAVVFRDWAEFLRQMRLGRHSGDGINMFQCRQCGRVYGAYSEP